MELDLIFDAGLLVLLLIPVGERNPNWRSYKVEDVLSLLPMFDVPAGLALVRL